MKKITFLVLSILPLSLLGQQVQFSTQTFLPVGGDVFTSEGAALSDSATVAYGTFLSTPVDVDDAFTDLFSGDYTVLDSVNFSGGDVFALTSVLSAGEEIYFWIFDGAIPSDISTVSEYALIGATIVPGFGTEIYDPTRVQSEGLLFAGTGDGTNIFLTAVPEPAHYAALLGVLGLAFVMWRRRR